MVIQGKQMRAGFKTISLRLAQKVASIDALRAKQKNYKSVVKSYADNGRKPVVKTVVQNKASEMLLGLKPKLKPCFEELIKEISENPNMAFADISVKVMRSLKVKYPEQFYASGPVRILYRDAIKNGAIKVSE